MGLCGRYVNLLLTQSSVQTNCLRFTPWVGWNSAQKFQVPSVKGDGCCACVPLEAPRAAQPQNYHRIPASRCCDAADEVTAPTPTHFQRQETSKFGQFFKGQTCITKYGASCSKETLVHKTLPAANCVRKLALSVASSLPHSASHTETHRVTLLRCNTLFLAWTKILFPGIFE